MQQRCSRKRAALPRCDFEAPQETSCSIARHTVHVVLEAAPPLPPFRCRSEEHTSELQSLMRISYAVFCLKKKIRKIIKKKKYKNKNNRRRYTNIQPLCKYENSR